MSPPRTSLTVLGCSGSYPGPGQACSGYLVEGAGRRVLLDLGSGSLANLQRHVALDEVDAVVLTHRHPDHWADLTGLRVALRYVLERDGLPVYGTAGTRARAESLCDGLGPTFDWRDTADGQELAVGDLRLRLSRTDHYVETYAVRVDDPTTGRSLAYSADTGPGWSLEALGPGLDLALVEATYATDEEAGEVLHLSATAAGAMARRAGARRLVLTHLLPGADADRHRRLGAEAFGAPVEIAATHERYDL